MQSSIKSSKVVRSLLTYLAQALWIIGTDAAKMRTHFIIICSPESNINRVAKVEIILAVGGGACPIPLDAALRTAGNANVRRRRDAMRQVQSAMVLCRMRVDVSHELADDAAVPSFWSKKGSNQRCGSASGTPCADYYLNERIDRESSSVKKDQRSTLRNICPDLTDPPLARIADLDNAIGQR
jgi:hypothetical protein